MMQQTKKHTFTELAELAAKSPAMKALPAAEVYALMTAAYDPDSEAFRTLYAALEEERIQLDRMNGNFSRMVKKINDDFDVGVMDMTVKASRKRLEEKHTAATKREEADAARLLESL